MEHFMENLKQIANKTYGSDRVRWILVANGGCAPIAINVAACSNLNISNVVLSSTPSLQSLLTASDRKKVEKTYHRILSGVAGKLFWWYALRNNGTFIQKYSQRNLMANLDSMGEDWTANCVSHARLHNGMSRFSTFAFLAGALKCDCQKQFNLLKNHEINIDIISGKNRRHRSARSWFWDKAKQNTTAAAYNYGKFRTNAEVLANFLANNGNRGRLIMINGRTCLAHEDAPGFAHSLLELVDDNISWISLT